MAQDMVQTTASIGQDDAVLFERPENDLYLRRKTRISSSGPDTRLVSRRLNLHGSLAFRISRCIRLCIVDGSNLGVDRGKTTARSRVSLAV
jgi:hypothetical protein